MVNMLLVKKAEAEIHSSGTIPEEIADEIRRSVYGYTHLSASCNECKKRPDDLFHHCVLCEGGDYDLCQKCIDNGKKCPGEHPLIEVHKDRDATAPVTPEDEPIFPISDPSPEFVEDDHESTLRALFLACMLGHEDIVSEIVQWGTGTSYVPPAGLG